MNGESGETISLPQELFGSRIRAIDNAGNLYLSANILQGTPVSIPRVKEPFVASSILLAPDDDIWVRRETAANGNYTVDDVISSRGERKMQVGLPTGSIVRDVDDALIYAVRQDDVGLLWLDVYPRVLPDGSTVPRSPMCSPEDGSGNAAGQTGPAQVSVVEGEEF